MPFPGLISNFLEMIGRNEPALRSPNPKVFVNPIFEIKKGFDMPVNKTELVEYLLRGIVVPFHMQICKTCHKIPDFEKWQQEDLNSSKFTACPDPWSNPSRGSDSDSLISAMSNYVE